MNNVKCINHPNSDAVAHCEECGKPVCEQCKKVIDRGHQSTTLGGGTNVHHSYHDVCPDCYDKFKGRVKNTRSGMMVAGIILIVVIVAINLL